MCAPVVGLGRWRFWGPVGHPAVRVWEWNMDQPEPEPAGHYPPLPVWLQPQLAGTAPESSRGSPECVFSTDKNQSVSVKHQFISSMKVCNIYCAYREIFTEQSWVDLPKQNLITRQDFSNSLITCLFPPAFTMAMMMFSVAMKGSSWRICLSITYKKRERMIKKKKSKINSAVNLMWFMKLLWIIYEIWNYLFLVFYCIL